MILTWDEPLYFKWRLMTRTSWRVRIAIFSATLLWIVISVVTDSPSSAERIRQISRYFMACFMFPLFIAGTCFPTHRMVSISKEGLSCINKFFGGFGPFALFSQHQWSKLGNQCMELRRPEEVHEDWGLLIIHTKYDRSFEVGVPRTVSMEQVANSLNQVGFVVTLSNWSPPEAVIAIL